MIREEAVPQAGTTSLANEIELKDLGMRGQLEDVFRNLNLIHDEITVSSDAARSRGLPEVANVLGLCVCNELFRQLRSLTNMIEGLGGRTYLSEERELVQEVSQRGDIRP